MQLAILVPDCLALDAAPGHGEQFEVLRSESPEHQVDYETAGFVPISGGSGEESHSHEGKDAPAFVPRRGEQDRGPN